MPHASAAVVAFIDRVELRHALQRRRRGVEALFRRLPPSAHTDLLAARIRLASGDRRGGTSSWRRMADPTTPRLRIEHGVLAALAAAHGEPTAARQLLIDVLTLADSCGLHRSIVDRGAATCGRCSDRCRPTVASADYVARLLATAGGVVPRHRAAQPRRSGRPR